MTPSTDPTPIYKAKTIPEEEFLLRARTHLCEVHTLPLDFLQNMKVLRKGCFKGLFGVLKYKPTQSDQGGSSFVLEAVPLLCGDIPSEVVKAVTMPTKRHWADDGLEKDGLMDSYLAETMNAKVKARLSEMGGTLSYRKSVPFVYLSIHYLEWEYGGERRICFHDPASDRIIAEGLPQDERVIRRLKRAGRHDAERPVLCLLTVIASIAMTLLWRPDATYGLLPYIGALVLGNAFLHSVISLLFQGKARTQRKNIKRRYNNNKTI